MRNAHIITSSCIRLSSWRGVGEDCIHSLLWKSLMPSAPKGASSQRRVWYPPDRSIHNSGSSLSRELGALGLLTPQLGQQGAGHNLSEVGGALWEDFLSSSPPCPFPPPPPTPPPNPPKKRVKSPKSVACPGGWRGAGPNQAPAVPSSGPQGLKSCHLRKEGTTLFPVGPFPGWGFPFGWFFSKEKYRTPS